MLKKWFGKKKDDEDERKESPGESPDAEQDSAPSDESPAGTAAPEKTAEEEKPVEVARASEAPETPETPEAKPGRWGFLRAGFKKTREKLRGIFGLRGKIDEEALESIEAALYEADFGPVMVAELIDGEQGLRAAWKAGEIENQEEILGFLKSKLKARLEEKQSTLARAESPPTVYLVAGVNGSGKTTSIAKMANRFLKQGDSVLLVAADTFRAAAVEQLTIWSERLGIEIVTGASNADPASVAFRGVERGLELGVDYVIVDTAGRLQTQVNLMRELNKIRKVIAKKRDDAPHECLLVLDSTNGQNAIRQAEAFKKEVEVSGIVLTKLDGTAKGGVVFAIHEQLDIPVKLVGVGEQIDDMTDFDPERFVDALFESE